MTGMETGMVIFQEPAGMDPGAGALPGTGTEISPAPAETSETATEMCRERAGAETRAISSPALLARSLSF